MEGRITGFPQRSGYKADIVEQGPGLNKQKVSRCSGLLVLLQHEISVGTRAAESSSIIKEEAFQVIDVHA